MCLHCLAREKKAKEIGKCTNLITESTKFSRKKKTQLQITKSEISEPINFDFFVYAVFGAREKAKETASEKSNIQISKNSFSSKSSNRSELEKDKSRFRERDLDGRGGGGEGREMTSMSLTRKLRSSAESSSQRAKASSWP